MLTFLADRLRAIDGVRDTETFVDLRLVKQTYQYGTRLIGVVRRTNGQLWFRSATGPWRRWPRCGPTVGLRVPERGTHRRSEPVSSDRRSGHREPARRDGGHPAAPAVRAGQPAARDSGRPPSTSGVRPRRQSSAASARRRRMNGVPVQTYDRVVRIVAWVFLLTTTVNRGRDRPAARHGAVILTSSPSPAVRRRGPRTRSRRTRSGRRSSSSRVRLSIHPAATLLVALTGGVASRFLRLPLDRRCRGAGRLADDHADARRRRRSRIRAGGRRGRSSRWTGHGRGRRRQPDGARAHRLCRDGHRPGAAPDPGCGRSTVHGRLADRPVQSNVFFAAMDREIARSARSGRGFCLLMMDLDELKAINDRLGHFTGDKVLRGVRHHAGRPPDRHGCPLRR